MSTATIRTQTSNTLITGYDTSKLLKGDNKTFRESMTAGADLTVGTLLDRVTATGALVEFKSDTAANNKKPVGVLLEDIANGETKDVTYIIDGDINEGLLILAKATDTLATVISGSTIRDLIRKETMGVNPVVFKELSAEDNY